MAAPTIVGVGPKGNGTGNVQYLFTGVSYQANDIGLLYIETNYNTTISVDQGWTQVSSSPQTATATRLHLYWKRLSASETGPTATQGGTTNHQCGGIIVIRGCVTSDYPWNVTNGSVETTSDTSVSVPGATTTVNDCLILAACCNGTDSNTVQGTGTPANPDLTEVAFTALNYNTTSGGGGGVSVVKGVRATAGTYGATTFSLVTASDKGLINIALKPPTSQTISNAGNINTGFAAGLAALVLTLSGVGNIAGAEVFGAAKLNQQIIGSGVISAENVGTPVIIATQYLLPQAIDSAEAFGNSQFNLNLLPSGIAGAKVFGTAKLNQQIAGSGIASAEIHGTPTIISEQIIIPTGIESGFAAGICKLNLNLLPSGIAGAEIFGDSILNLKILPAGVSAAEIIGMAALFFGAGTQRLYPASILSIESPGEPIITLYDYKIVGKWNKSWGRLFTEVKDGNKA